MGGSHPATAANFYNNKFCLIKLTISGTTFTATKTRHNIK